VSAVGIDQLLANNKENLTWDDLTLLFGGTIPTSKNNILLGNEGKIYLRLGGAHKNSETNKGEYWTQNLILINPSCK
jgi:hypothetical protein